MKINNTRFASDYSEIIRLYDLDMFSRAHTEVARALNNHLHLNFDDVSDMSIENFASHFNSIHDAETFFIAGEIFKYSAAIENKFENGASTRSLYEKALFLFIQAFSANDLRINTVAEMSLCEIGNKISHDTLPQFLFTKLEVLNIQCQNIHNPVATTVDA